MFICSIYSPLCWFSGLKHFIIFLIKEEEREESMKKEEVEKDGSRILPGFLDKYNERA